MLHFRVSEFYDLNKQCSRPPFICWRIATHPPCLLRLSCLLLESEVTGLSLAKAHRTSHQNELETSDKLEPANTIPMASVRKALNDTRL